VGGQPGAVAVVVAAGSFPIEAVVGGSTAIERVIAALASLPAAGEVVVAPILSMGNRTPARLGARVTLSRPRDTRLEAIRSALEAAQPSATVLLHDADQPLVTSQWLSDALAGTTDHPVVASGAPVKAAFKRVAGGVIEETVPRDRLVRLVGPRAFRREVLSEVLLHADAEGWPCDDEVRAARLAGVPVAVHLVTDVNVRVTDALSAELAGRLASGC
jgi:2-C-methyl-D-erythritol 4-phosphate cytidylyltransferase